MQLTFEWAPKWLESCRDEKGKALGNQLIKIREYACFPPVGMVYAFENTETSHHERDFFCFKVANIVSYEYFQVLRENFSVILEPCFNRDWNSQAVILSPYDESSAARCLHSTYGWKWQ